MKKLFVVVLFLGFYANSVLAKQDNIEVLEVTGSVLTEGAAIDNVLKQTISRDDIEMIAPASVVDLLRNVPGVNVTQQGGNGGLTFISLRGGEPNFTVVLIDGVKVNDIINSRGGGYDFVGLDPLLVQRIDIFFGGLSPVFGSEALGGVISITTLTASVTSKGLSVEVGSDKQHAESFHLAAPINERVLVNISGANRDGGDAVDGDSLERSQINFKLNSVRGDEVNWQLSLFHSLGESSSFPEDSGGDQLAVIRQPEERDFRQNNMAGSINWAISDVWSLDIKTTYAKHDEETNNPGIAVGILQAVPQVRSDSEYTRTDFNITNTFFLSKSTTLGLGAEIGREEGSFDSTINFGFPVVADFDINRDVYALFSEFNHQVMKNLSITGGVRFDDADGIEETTFRFSTNYSLTSTGTEFVFQYGEGFKLPSFFALGHPLVGNKDLEPEFSKNTALTAQQHFFENKLMISATYFYNRFSNLIDFEPVLFTNVNRSKVVANGGELKLTFAPSRDVETSLYITYTDYNTDAGVTLRRRPDWTGGASLSWQPSERNVVHIQANHINEFIDSSVPTGVSRLDGYTKFDVSFGWLLTAKVNLKLIINNLLNEGFEETVGFSDPGREFRLQLKASI